MEGSSKNEKHNTQLMAKLNKTMNLVIRRRCVRKTFCVRDQQLEHELQQTGSRPSRRRSPKIAAMSQPRSLAHCQVGESRRALTDKASPGFYPISRAKVKMISPKQMLPRQYKVKEIVPMCSSDPLFVYFSIRLIPMCFLRYTSVDMHPFFYSSELLKLVVDYMGLVPSRFYLSECSQDLRRDVHLVAHLDEWDFLIAFDERLVNPKYLRLEVGALSDRLISKRFSGDELDKDRHLRLECLVEGKSINELMKLGEKSLADILVSSIVRMNVPIIDCALKCIEAHGNATPILPEPLRRKDVQAALMKADALELLKRVTGNNFLNNEFLAEDLLMCAVKFRARRCENYLRGFTKDWTEIDGMLEACASAGDLDRVKILCSPEKRVTNEYIRSALIQAVRMRHLDVAAFLLSEWSRKRCYKLRERDRIELLEELLRALRSGGDPSVEFLNWLFEGIEDMDGVRIVYLTLLQFACRERFRTMCHFLVGRGCTRMGMWNPPVELDNSDLLDLLDLCCGLKKGSLCKEDPAVELFLLKRGLHVRKLEGNRNPVIWVLKEGFWDASFANRVELIKYYLMLDRTLATKIDRFEAGKQFLVTPLGALEVLGQPQTVIWSGTNDIWHADYVPADRKRRKDEWRRSRPNEVEIQALRDIRTALLEHGADKTHLFGPGIFELSLCGKYLQYVSIEFMQRIIHLRADVNEKGPKGLPPLSWLLSQGRHNMFVAADLLLKYGADIDAKDDWGKTAIFRAIVQNKVAIVDWLIKNGADLTIPDNHGVRPIDIARFCAKERQYSRDIIQKIEAVIGDTDTRDIDGLRSMQDPPLGMELNDNDWRFHDEYWTRLEF